MTKLPNFPPLSGGKTSRKATKHYTNLAMYLDPKPFSLLSWLLYQCDTDNSVEYSHELLERYRATCKHIEQEYGSFNANKALGSIRKDFKALCSLGHLLPTNKDKVFLVNPMLSFEGLSAGKYRMVQDRYQETFKNCVAFKGSSIVYIRLFCADYTALFT